MRNRKAMLLAFTVVALSSLISLKLLAQQDRYSLKVPDGLAFSEFKGVRRLAGSVRQRNGK